MKPNVLEKKNKTKNFFFKSGGCCGQGTNLLVSVSPPAIIIRIMVKKYSGVKRHIGMEHNDTMSTFNSSPHLFAKNYSGLFIYNYLSMYFFLFLI